MERITFINHAGKESLLLDFSGVRAMEAAAMIDHAKTLISGRPAHSLRTLTDVTDMHFDHELSQKMKEFTSHNKPYVMAAAVVGVAGLKRIIFNAVIAFSGRKLTTFDDRDSAKRWLAEQ